VNILGSKTNAIEVTSIVTNAKPTSTHTWPNELSLKLKGSNMAKIKITIATHNITANHGFSLTGAG
jgi:hypothetical protein